MEQPAPDTRTALLNAALACFAEHGFDGTSIRMIADLAQRPLSLLAHYFGNKEGLYLEVFKYLFESTHRRRNQPPVHPGGVAPRDREEAIRLLREQIHYIYEDVMEDAIHPDPLKEKGTRLWLQEIRCPRPCLRPLLTQHLAPVVETLKSCIQVLRPDLKEAEVIFLGSSILGQVAGHGLMVGMNRVVWGESSLPGSAFQASELLVELCLQGLLGGNSSLNFKDCNSPT